MRRKLLVAAAVAAMSAGASAQNVKIGVVTFLSGRRRSACRPRTRPSSSPNR